MMTHTFLVDWPKIHANIADLNEIVTPYSGPVTVLSNPEHYFSEQWNTMLTSVRNTPSDLVLWVMGDVTLPTRFWEFYPEVERVLSSRRVGIYGPNVQYTFHQWDLQSLTQIEPHVYEVPCSEPNCLFVKREVLLNVQPIDITKNRYGWGVDLMLSATAESMGLVTVRDYRFVAGHPLFTGYDEKQAESQMQSWKDSLNPQLRAIMDRRWQWGLEHNLNWKKRHEAQGI